MLRDHYEELLKNSAYSHENEDIWEHFGMSSIISKVFEHIIAERLEVYLGTNNNQFGFKSGLSAGLQQLLSICDQYCAMHSITFAVKKSVCSLLDVVWK